MTFHTSPWRRRESHPAPVDANDRTSLLAPPFAGLEGVEPSSAVLEAALHPMHRPIAPRTRIELVSLGRQPSCDSQSHHEAFVSSPRVERGQAP